MRSEHPLLTGQTRCVLFFVIGKKTEINMQYVGLICKVHENQKENAKLAALAVVLTLRSASASYTRVVK